MAILAQSLSGQRYVEPARSIAAGCHLQTHESKPGESSHRITCELQGEASGRVIFLNNANVTTDESLDLSIHGHERTTVTDEFKRDAE